MEYVQMTLNDWLNIKEQLRRDLFEVQEKFVKIGYALRKIEEEKLYLQDGYATVADFAKAEYGLEKTTVSRFININKKYSIDGYSERLQPEYARFGSSKLGEMLSLPDKDLEMIHPEATRESIRELKQFNRITPEPAAVDDLGRVIEEFFRENQELLNELCSSVDYVENNVDKLVEIVNPSGNRMYRKGIFYLMMYDSEIKIKQFGHDPRNMTWKEFFGIVHQLFDDDLGPDTWSNHFAEVGEMVEENVLPEPAKGEESAEEQLPGQMDVTNYPEMMPEPVEEKSEKPNNSEPEVLSKQPEVLSKEEKTLSAQPEMVVPKEDTPAAEAPENTESERPATAEPKKPVAPAQQFLEKQEETAVLTTPEKTSETAVITTRWDQLKGMSIEKAAAELSWAVYEAKEIGVMPEKMYWMQWLSEEADEEDEE